MKKDGSNRKLRNTKITVLTGFLLFLISTAVSLAGWYTFGILGLLGIINDRNRILLWAVNLLFLFVIAGAFVDWLLRHIFFKKTEKLIDAMKRVSDGEFSIRLSTGKKITEPGPITVTAFNDMAVSLQSKDTLNKDFAGNFSHELKTPLGTINGFARVLKSDGLTEEEKNEYLDIIIEESERLALLSNNILLLSRLENHTDPIKKEEYNLTEQLRQITAAMYHKWSEKNIEIVFDGHELTLTANRELMVQVWINLLDNAVKFSPPGEIIYINVTKNADCTTVGIKNYGNTLIEEELSHIFDKFYQGDSDKKALGNGLGLPMVKKIIELHGGSITAQINKDSITFTASLPYTN